MHCFFFFFYDDCGFYKNVFYELTQKELFCITTYEIVKCGLSHMAILFYTMELDREIFYGRAGKSKIQT